MATLDAQLWGRLCSHQVTAVATIYEASYWRTRLLCMLRLLQRVSLGPNGEHSAKVGSIGIGLEPAPIGKAAVAIHRHQVRLPE